MGRVAILGFVFVLSFVLLPRQVAESGGDEFFHDDPDRAASFAAGVDTWVKKSGSFSTGSSRFDGEWAFGTHVMASLGFGQVALRHPSLAASSRASMDASLSRLLDPKTRSFDSDAWQADALESLDGDAGHAAFLGYANLALSLRRFLGESEFDERGSRITEALARRLERSEILMLETYPDERYPVDNTAVVASIALHDRALGRAPRPVVRRFLESFEKRYVDPTTGLVIQAVSAGGQPVDRPRGSGSALGAYFFSFVDEALSSRLHRAVTEQLSADVLGFGVVSEYPAGVSGSGDIDSGPLVFGWSISAMGFLLGSAKAQRDEATFRELWRSFYLLGAPKRRKNVEHFVSGGALGDAIVFAMLTALPAKRWSEAT
jgi:hypothetical protein